MVYVAFAVNLAALTMNLALLARGQLGAWSAVAMVLSAFGVFLTFPIVVRRLGGRA